MTFLEVASTIAGTVMAFAGVPQVIKIFQRKSAKDISAVTYMIVEVGAIIWILYGLEIKSFPLVLTNCLGMLTNTLILIGCHLYGQTS